jgi:uncharacterized protein YjbI with pentapeptide repeats
MAHLRRMGCYIPPEKPSMMKRIIAPLKWVETIAIEPISRKISNTNLFNILAKLGFLFAAIVFLTEFSDRRERTIFEAWNVVNEGKGSRSGVVRLALERLSRERFSLEGIDASQTNLFGANLERADLSAANLKETSLRSANLKGAFLWYADLEKSDLNGANLNGASLNGANLKGAELNNANLEAASLNGANLEGAKFCNTIMPDGKNARWQNK